MRHIAAYALLVLGGNDAPSVADVEKVVKDAGATADKEQIEKLVAAMEGKQFHELVETGLKSLSSMGTAAPAAGGSAAAAGGAPKKEEKVEEPEEDVDIGGMFGDEDDY
jgi:large subunit ribosomal protein LP2